MAKQMKVHFPTVHETFVCSQLYTSIKDHCLFTPCQNDWVLYTQNNCNSWLYNEAIKDECQNIWWGQRWRNTTVALCVRYASVEGAVKKRFSTPYRNAKVLSDISNHCNCWSIGRERSLSVDMCVLIQNGAAVWSRSVKPVFKNSILRLHVCIM